MCTKLSECLDTLKAKNIKITKGRINLLSIFIKSPNKYFKPDVLKDYLKKQNLNSSLVTIYRNLKLFERLNLLKTITTRDGNKLYEWNSSKKNYSDCYSHFICKDCGTIINHFIYPDIIDLLEINNKNPMNSVEVIEIKLYGCCSNCINKKSNTNK